MLRRHTPQEIALRTHSTAVETETEVSISALQTPVVHLKTAFPWKRFLGVAGCVVAFTLALLFHADRAYAPGKNYELGYQATTALIALLWGWRVRGKAGALSAFGLALAALATIAAYVMTQRGWESFFRNLLDGLWLFAPMVLSGIFGATAGTMWEKRRNPKR